PEGCAICEATWGNYWAEVEGQRMFFCCEICEIEFRNMINEVKRRTGWETIDEIKMTGDQRERRCTAISGGHSYRFSIGFNSQGAIRIFQEDN
ncbi:MAG TPA: TA0938 family protein, partial [Candidatus Hodarchaeales archaeon]|nr:TA0938 family protein [Candidatus Hodarchaeales archaeon]